MAIRGRQQSLLYTQSALCCRQRSAVTSARAIFVKVFVKFRLMVNIQANIQGIKKGPVPKDTGPVVNGYSILLGYKSHLKFFVRHHHLGDQ